MELKEVINKNPNSINFNGKTYNFLSREMQDALLAIGILTFRYYPQEKLLIASDNFVSVLKAEKIYTNMPKSLADSFIAEEDRAILYDMATRIDNGERKVSEILATRSGRLSRVTICAIETSPDGKNLTMAGIVEDVAETKRSSALLEALSRDFSCVYYCDYKKNIVIPHRVIKSVQDLMEGIWDHHPAYEVMYETFVEKAVIDAEKDEMLRLFSVENLRKVFKDRDVFVHDFRININGKIVYCRIKIVNLSQTEELTEFVMGFSNMSNEQASELERLAFVDSITGGNNYNSFKLKVRDLKASGYMMSMDIRQFKMVNTICGVTYGDRVLKKIWETIVNYCSSDVIAGHINADHFVMFFPEAEKKDIIEIIEELTNQMFLLSQTLKCPRLHPYFGVTKYFPGSPIESAYSETSVAKHSVKEEKNTNFRFFSRKENAMNVKFKTMEDSFPSALANGDFEIWYQPKYNPLDNSIVGAEALVRWRLSKTDKLIPPGEFIPLFERNGFIRTLDEYVFDSVCRYLKKRINLGLKVVPVSVNLSRASLFIEGVAQQYNNIIEDVGISPSLVPLEITESATASGQTMWGIITDFRNNGFTLCVDDFGTGYSTLSMLSRRQYSNLKLDKSLIDEIKNDDGFKLIKHTIALAKDLGMNVTAEGVEDTEQRNLLKKLNCDTIQGFLYSPPIPAENFSILLNN